MGQLSGKRVLITGGAGGIGLETGRAFLKEGCEVILTDINEQGLREAAQRLASDKVHTFVNDVTKFDEVEALGRRIQSEIGFVDILVNNAGIGASGEIKDMTIEEWKRLIDINIWGVIHFVKVFMPPMVERRSGHIVNLSSGQAFFPVPTWGAYAATKFFVAGFSEALHYEAARFNIKVTTVFPYVVNSPFYSAINPETFGGKMVVKLVPYYAVSPEKTGRIIVRAVKKGKKYEMHHPLNAMNYYFNRLFPLVTEGTGIALAWALTRRKGEKES